jgi:hypothetical protein
MDGRKPVSNRLRGYDSAVGPESLWNLTIGAPDSRNPAESEFTGSGSAIGQVGQVLSEISYAG